MCCRAFPLFLCLCGSHSFISFLDKPICGSHSEWVAYSLYSLPFFFFYLDSLVLYFNMIKKKFSLKFTNFHPRNELVGGFTLLSLLSSGPCGGKKKHKEFTRFHISHSHDCDFFFAEAEAPVFLSLFSTLPRTIFPLTLIYCVATTSFISAPSKAADDLNDICVAIYHCLSTGGRRHRLFASV